MLTPGFLKPTILIADDDADTRSILESLLMDEGYPVITARDGQEALALSQEHIGAILLDIEMPVMNGLEACHALQRDPRTAAIPVMFLSGWDDPQVVKMALNAGAFDVLKKPIRMAELHVKLSALSWFSEAGLVQDKRARFKETVKRIEVAYQAEEAASESQWHASAMA